MVINRLVLRTYNSLFYATRILKNTDNPANKYLEKNINETEELQIYLQHLVKRKSRMILPWTMHIDINLDISEYKKENTSPYMYRNRFHNTIQKYHNYKHNCTDTSNVE